MRRRFVELLGLWGYPTYPKHKSFDLNPQELCNNMCGELKETTSAGSNPGFTLKKGLISKTIVIFRK